MLAESTQGVILYTPNELNRLYQFGVLFHIYVLYKSLLVDLLVNEKNTSI